jgi:hypothetical protein
MQMQLTANKIDQRYKECSLKRPEEKMTLRDKKYKWMPLVWKMILLNTGLEQRLHRHNDILKDNTNS